MSRNSKVSSWTDLLKSIWEIITFFINRKKKLEKKERERKQKVVEGIRKGYGEIDSKTEERRKNDTKDRLNDMFN